MRTEVNTWHGFQPGDVVVEVDRLGPVTVERDGNASFGTARVAGTVRRGFLTARGTFIFDSGEGEYGVSPNYEDFKPYPPLLDAEFQPDYRAAMDAYAHQLHELRRAVGSTPDGALRHQLEQILMAVPPPVMVKPIQPPVTHADLANVINQVFVGARKHRADYTADTVAHAVGLLLQRRLGIEVK